MATWVIMATTTSKFTDMSESGKQGFALKLERQTARLKGVWVAAEMGISPALLSAMENGYRRWSPDLIRKFKAAIKRGETQ